MFQFPAFASQTRWQVFNLPGCPIRRSRDQGLFASPPGFSQLITSFFASESQGIHRLPLLTFPYLVHQRTGLIYLKLALLFKNFLFIVQHVKDLLPFSRLCGE